MRRNLWVIGLVVTLVLASGILGAAKKVVFVGVGTQISPVYDSVISQDEPCWVRHGWQGQQAPGQQPGFKDDYGSQKFVAAGIVLTIIAPQFVFTIEDIIPEVVVI